MRISDDIHNYFENLVVQYIIETKLDTKYDSDFIADFVCIVLNQLPARYIRHEVDMSFYLPASERFDMETKVKLAAEKAMTFMLDLSKTKKRD